MINADRPAPPNPDIYLGRDSMSYAVSSRWIRVSWLGRRSDTVRMYRQRLSGVDPRRRFSGSLPATTLGAVSQRCRRCLQSRPTAMADGRRQAPTFSVRRVRITHPT